MATKGFAYPCRASCRFQGRKGLIVLDQIRAVDKSRLVKKLGALGKGAQAAVCARLQEMFAY